MKNKALARFFAVAMAASVSLGSVPAMNVFAAAANSENAAVTSTNDSDYTYLYAGLTWKEYWAAEDVYDAGDDTAIDVRDTRADVEEKDRGAYDAVTRATVDHGLERGSFQTTAEITDTNGNTYGISYWDGSTLYFTDGRSATVDSDNKVFTLSDGTTFTMKDYTMKGLKYVPVKVKTSELADFQKKYTTVANGSELRGGYEENNLKTYDVIAAVDANTNGLKTATEQKDGTFTFSARAEGTDSGVKETADSTDETLKKAVNITPEIQDPDTGKDYGVFVRIHFKGDDYGGLGEKMQAVKWTYYGNDSTRTKALRSFGTKFAADNWMHRKNGIQLGLTDSVRCQLPVGTDGTGYWRITIYALGYEDYTYDFELKSSDILPNAADAANTSALQTAVESAESAKQSDYSAANWTTLQTRLFEGKTAMVRRSGALDADGNMTADISQADVDAATTALNTALSSNNVQKPAATKITSIKGGKKNITVKWSKKSGVSGYQVRYSTNKKLKKAATKNVSSKKNSYKISKLKSKKTYYVQVRTTKNVNGKKVYSSWSTAKSAKTK